MTGTAESLNLAVAAGRLLYQARKPDLRPISSQHTHGTLGIGPPGTGSIPSTST